MVYDRYAAKNDKDHLINLKLKNQEIHRQTL